MDSSALDLLIDAGEKYKPAKASVMTPNTNMVLEPADFDFFIVVPLINQIFRFYPGQARALPAMAAVLKVYTTQVRKVRFKVR